MLNDNDPKHDNIYNSVGLEACPLGSSDNNSLDLVINPF